MSDYLKSNVTFANILTILLLACGVAASWARMDVLAGRQGDEIAENKQAIRSNADAVQKLQSEFNNKLSDREMVLRKEMDKRNDEVRITLARTDARLEVLSRELGEIKSSLRSLETHIAWIVKQDKRSQAK